MYTARAIAHAVARAIAHAHRGVCASVWYGELCTHSCIFN